ncbi:MAG: hypothetical protein Tsb009_00160 [Planctomycetaceae bacterium]
MESDEFAACDKAYDEPENIASEPAVEARKRLRGREFLSSLMNRSPMKFGFLEEF